MPKNYCIMQIWAESGKSALPICNYSQILYQFLTFTQNLKRSRSMRETRPTTVGWATSKKGSISFWVACPTHVKGIFWKVTNITNRENRRMTLATQRFFKSIIWGSCSWLFSSSEAHLKPHPKFAIYFDNSTQPQKMIKPKGGSTKDIRIAAVMQMTPKTADPLNSVPYPYLLLSQLQLGPSQWLSW